jgi:hypothetical protein
MFGAELAALRRERREPDRRIKIVEQAEAAVAKARPGAMDLDG